MIRVRVCRDTCGVRVCLGLWKTCPLRCLRCARLRLALRLAGCIPCALRSLQGAHCGGTPRRQTARGAVQPFSRAGAPGLRACQAVGCGPDAAMLRQGGAVAKAAVRVAVAAQAAMQPPGPPAAAQSRSLCARVADELGECAGGRSAPLQRQPAVLPAGADAGAQPHADCRRLPGARGPGRGGEECSRGKRSLRRGLRLKQGSCGASPRSGLSCGASVRACPPGCRSSSAARQQFLHTSGVKVVSGWTHLCRSDPA